MLRKLDPPHLLIIAYLVTILAGSLLLATPWAARNGSVDFLTALFTSTSAVCVTGLVVVDTGTYWTGFGHLVIIILSQIGGLGIMAFATLFIVAFKQRISLKQRLAVQQSLGKSDLGGLMGILKRLVLFTFVVELIGALLLTIYWVPSMGLKKALWFGVFHAVSAFNNAGFDLFGNYSSMTGMVASAPVLLILSVLFIIGSLGFLVVYELYKYKHKKRLSLHSRLVLIVTGLVLVTGTLTFYLLEFNNVLANLPGSSKVVVAFFQSATRTAGFSAVDMQSTFLPTQILIMALMFIGGAPGSTAGGIKVTTMGVLWISVVSLLKDKRDSVFMYRRLPESVVSRAYAIFFLATTLIILISFVLTLSNDFTFNRVLFEAVSAAGTVGLSLGITPELDVLGRIFIIITMFLGRLGPLTIGYAIGLSKDGNGIRYPEEDIMLG